MAVKPERADVVVAGAGPVGLAAASALAQRGLEVRCIAPHPGARWLANYGIWSHDAPAAGLTPSLLSVVRPAVLVEAGGRVVETGGSYGAIDKVAWQQALLDTPGLMLIHDRVEVVSENAVGYEVECASGRKLTTSLVLDATGVHVAGRSGRREGVAAQTAWGVEIEPSGPMGVELADGPIRLMDWSFDPLEAGPPSFLYAIPRGDGRVFVEETCWCARPAMDPGILKDRLYRRLSAMGVRVARSWENSEERCFIPMDDEPHAGTDRVPIGAAAGWVHPASGYLLGHALRWVQPVVEVAAQQVSAGAPPREVAEAARALVWPADRRAAFALYAFGREALLPKDREGMSAFFSAFFALAPTDWRDFLGASATDPRLAAIMMRFFVRAPWSLRLSLAMRSLSADGVRLVGGLVRARR